MPTVSTAAPLARATTPRTFCVMAHSYRVSGSGGVRSWHGQQGQSRPGSQEAEEGQEAQGGTGDDIGHPTVAALDGAPRPTQVTLFSTTQSALSGRHDADCVALNVVVVAGNGSSTVPS